MFMIGLCYGCSYSANKFEDWKILTQEWRSCVAPSTYNLPWPMHAVLLELKVWHAKFVCVIPSGMPDVLALTLSRLNNVSAGFKCY
jgi:hypothetical protein